MERIARKHAYICSSERAYRRSDERENVFESDRELEVGDCIVFDGLRWYVEEVIR